MSAEKDVQIEIFLRFLKLFGISGKPQGPSLVGRSFFPQLYLTSLYALWIHAIASGELRATDPTSRKQWIELP